MCFLSYWYLLPPAVLLLLFAERRTRDESLFCAYVQEGRDVLDCSQVAIFY